MENNYKQKYYEMKRKYLESKNILLHMIENKHIQKGGVFSIGVYDDEVDGHRYKVYRTDEHKNFVFREVPFREIDKSDLTSDLRKPDRTKILYINDLDTFNYFTNKYGIYGEWELYIDWAKLSRTYKGFYLNKDNKDLFANVYAKARKGKFRLDSWWSNEYEKLTYDVMIFR